MNFLNIIEKKLSLGKKNEIAKLLKTDVKSLEAFEKSYAKSILSQGPSDNFFEINAKQAAEMVPTVAIDNQEVEMLIDRIVNELLAQTTIYEFDGETLKTIEEKKLTSNRIVSQEDINKLPPPLQPQLTGELMKVDMPGPSYELVLWYYSEYRKHMGTEKGKMAYNHFRQGLDILDLDPILYQVIGMNQNSIGHWFPALVRAIGRQEFFKVPKTTYIEVPITLLQLTRVEWGELTPTTLAIVDRFCQKAFHLDESQEYFVKTGTFSSKYDYRNAYVHGPKEVRELGEYLLFIHHQALQMAAPTATPTIVGASTTNEWVVREFIPDKENNPCIYKGLPLHTEYRIFVDFDSLKVIGMSPYWEPETMKRRFSCEADANTPHQVHDYIIFAAHEETLMKRYQENAQKVKNHIEAMLPDMDLHGQWSIDVMQNGNDFWVIDMALAQNSALLNCVPKELRKPTEERWMPQLEK